MNLEINIMTETKKWYQSKTIQANALLIIAGVCSALAGELELGGSITFLGLINIVLRTITTTAISK
jgi:hypothetical protein